MTERPILFNGEMVRAILDGYKTQTRRPVHKDIVSAIVGAGECHYEGEIDFARAILRKAGEK